MTPESHAAILAHGEKCAPHEACGLLVVIKGREHYWPCRNIAQDKQFTIHPADFAAAEDAGEITTVVHTHVHSPALPSDADRRGCEESGLPWAIVGWPSGAVHNLTPCGWKAPLIGRQFQYSLMDCYTLARDYYQEKLGIKLKDVPRTEGWEERNEDLCVRSYEDCGFVRVKDGPQEHDLLLFQIFYPVPHHVGVYTGDGFFLHHAKNRLSSKDRWAGIWRMATTHILRHKELG